MAPQGDMPVWLTKKLNELSGKVDSAFYRGDVVAAMRRLRVYDCIFCGWYYGNAKNDPM